ncbi:MAG: hypothetical protein JRH11_00965 [Deltaproteobacteria bacterium]|nr:hypothetical protein [Deltaproteobacteria bacterium]
MKFPHIAYGTPRKLPKAKRLEGRVVVLDVAFASEAGGVSFDKVTRKFIDGLGDRLAMWVDHHDHALHREYDSDPRFVLATKAQHGACPEMITPALVERAGPIDTICCHIDFDGLCSAAKWIRGGEEPYAGADADARAIDTRTGTPSEIAATVDRALRARHRDDGLKGIIIRFLVTGAEDPGIYAEIQKAAEGLKRMEAESRRLAGEYRFVGDVAVVDARDRKGPYDKTLLLLIGQERAPISVVYDESAVTAAAQFDSGIDLLAILGLSGGMPTRVSVAPKELEATLEALQNRAKSDPKGR